ncbi:hypothetical protein M1278_01465 [Candidatus Marsarchaeota archaeon]|nr:hypothetical protein [Candidatus Marsarchaeota archaeon]
MIKKIEITEFDKINLMRFFLAVFALLEVAAHLFASPGSTPAVTFWLQVEIAFYVIIAVVYLFGLRIYYVPALLFSVFNICVFFISAIVVLPGITTTLLIGHIQFLQYSYGRGVSLFNWIFLIILGTFALKYDTGSEINASIKSIKLKSS